MPEQPPAENLHQTDPTGRVSALTETREGKEENDGQSQRREQVRLLERVVRPVMENAGNDLIYYKLDRISANKPTAAMEAICRCALGVAPWIENRHHPDYLPQTPDPDRRKRSKIAEMTRQAICRLLDPENPDYLPFNSVKQNLVEAGILAQAVLRAPTELWKKMPTTTKQRMLAEWVRSRDIHPGKHNWIVYSGLVEAALLKFGGGCNKDLIVTAAKLARKLYVGDGFHSDQGPMMKFDYYTSFVITSGLWEILETACEHGIHIPPRWVEEIKLQTRRQAHVLENLISPEATFPVMGRSSCYRAGALHTLAFCAWKENLPEELSEGGVRNALTQVIARTLPHNAFEDEGWLTIGFTDHQPKLAEFYINTGSLYFCTTAFASLGLPHSHPFWNCPSENWTQKRIWNGENVRTGKPLNEFPIPLADRIKDKLRRGWNRLHGKSEVPLTIERS